MSAEPLHQDIEFYNGSGSLEMINGHEFKVPELVTAGNLHRLDNPKAELARGQIPGLETGRLETNKFAPSHALTFADFNKGLDFTVFSYQFSNQAFTPYVRGIVSGKPFFKFDDMWWVDVELESLPSVKHGCLGVWGVTLNDRFDWNPYLYVVEGRH